MYNILVSVGKGYKKYFIQIDCLQIELLGYNSKGCILISSRNIMFLSDLEDGIHTKRVSLINQSGCDTINATEREMQEPLNIREFRDFNPRDKKKRPSNWDVTPYQLNGGRYKPRVKFSNGRGLDDRSVEALKRFGRCFFCVEVGHRALECPENPDSMNFRNQKIFLI